MLTRKCCVTLDLESDHGFYDQDTYDIINNDLEVFVGLVREMDISLTIFVTGIFLERFPKVVRFLSDNLNCEFALHSYGHRQTVCPKEAEKACGVFERFFGYKPEGYRVPYGKISPEQIGQLKRLGIAYHSGIGRDFLRNQDMVYPGVFQYDNGLLDIPVSSFSFLNLPLGMGYLNFLNRSAIAQNELETEPLVFYFHLHDLFKSKAYFKLPFYFKIFYLNKEFFMEKPWERFKDFLRFLIKNKYSFYTLKEYLDDIDSNNRICR